MPPRYGGKKDWLIWLKNPVTWIELPCNQPLCYGFKLLTTLVHCFTWFILEMNACQAQVISRRYTRLITCASQVKLISKWILLSYNLSLYYEFKLLTTTIHFFISFMCEDRLRLIEPCIMWSQCDTVRVSGARPSTKFDWLAVCCCIAYLNYSQLWHISLVVSWKASHVLRSDQKRRDIAAWWSLIGINRRIPKQ